MITDEEYDELMKLFFSPDNTPKEQPKKKTIIMWIRQCLSKR